MGLAGKAILVTGGTGSFGQKFTEIASERRLNGGKAWKKDIEHLRHFYPDGAMQRCLDRLGI